MRLNDLFEETPIDEKYRPLYEKALKVKDEHESSLKAQNPPAPFLNPEKLEVPVLDSDSKPTVSVPSLGNEFETHSDVASGAVTFEQPAPLTEQEAVDRRSK